MTLKTQEDSPRIKKQVSSSDLSQGSSSKLIPMEAEKSKDVAAVVAKGDDGIPSSDRVLTSAAVATSSNRRGAASTHSINTVMDNWRVTFLGHGGVGKTALAIQVRKTHLPCARLS